MNRRIKFKRIVSFGRFIKWLASVDSLIFKDTQIIDQFVFKGTKKSLYYGLQITVKRIFWKV